MEIIIYWYNAELYGDNISICGTVPQLVCA